MDPFQICNQQTWGEILNNLESLEDKLNLLRSNSALEAVFNETKVEWLFASVLPIILKKYEKWFPNSCYNNSLIEGFRSCRLVSSLCNKAIDKYVKGYWEEEEQQRFPAILGSVRMLYEPQKIVDFCNQVEDHPQNMSPILIRTLNVTYDGSNDQDESSKVHLLALLEKIGNHLLGFEMEPCGFTDVATLVEFFGIVFSFLPNLRQFVGFVQSVDDDDDEEDDLIPVLQLPPPHLKKLWLFHEDEDSDNSKSVPVISFEKYFPQLTSLKLDFRFWIDDIYNKKEGIFPNLQYFEMNRIPFMEKGVQDRVMELIMNLTVPQLKLLSLQFDSRPRHYRGTDARMNLIEQMGLFFLQRKYSSSIQRWKSINSGGMTVDSPFKFMCVKFYDKDKVNVLPFPKRDPVPEKKRGKCSNVIAAVVPPVQPPLEDPEEKEEPATPFKPPEKTKKVEITQWKPLKPISVSSECTIM